MFPNEISDYDIIGKGFDISSYRSILYFEFVL